MRESTFTNAICKAESKQISKDFAYCEDTISRQAALDAMDTWDKFGCGPDDKLVRYDDDKHYIPYVRYEDMVHAIKHLPAAQPQRMRGRWKRTYLDHVAMGERPSILYCSECSQCIAYPTNYCPNCGSYNGG